MKKIALLLLMHIVVITGIITAEKLTVLTGVAKPHGIALDDNRIYVIENTSIFIYSKKEFTLEKKFGTAGEGPGEFKNLALVIPRDDRLLINSTGKISYYKKDGTFIKEIKGSGGIGSGMYWPLENGYVGRGVSIENQAATITINFFNEKLEKGPRVYAMEAPSMGSGKVEVLKQSFLYRTYRNKIFVAAKPGFIIDVMDQTGKPLSVIRQKYEKRKLTPQDEKIIKEFLQNRYKERYALIKDRIAFPGHFPEIQYFTVEDDLIYVVTWKKQGEKVEFYIFDMEGKLRKTLFMPVKFENALYFYPFAIKNSTLYQLIENEKEEWELHANEIK